MMGPEALRVPFRLALLMALALFAGELLEIWVFAALPSLPEPIEALLDALLLTAVATPFLYLLLVRPLSLEILRRRKAEEGLRSLNAEFAKLNQELEGRVDQRTAELASANDQLTREIEEKRLALDNVWKSNDLLRMVIESTCDLVMIYDVAAARCSFVNGRVMDLLGYTPESVCAAGTDFLRDTLDPEAYGSLKKLGQLGQEQDEDCSEQLDWRMRGSDGGYRRMAVRALVLRESPGDGATELLLRATGT